MPDCMDQYVGYMFDQLKESSACQAEIEKQTAEMKRFTEMYQNPLFNALITHAEIIPIGILVTLISSLILRRKQPKTA